MPTITYAGRVADSRKGLPIFLDALEILLSADLPSFRTRIIGGAPAEVASVEHTIRQSDACGPALEAGRIELWSRVERSALSELYSRSTVVCVPSLREQFGMVAVEAMMCGVPVVASRIGGLQDLVVHDMTGYLVDRLNPPALASALAQFIRNRRLSAWMGRNALLWSRSRFAMGAIACRYVDLYESLGRGTPPSPDEEARPAPMHQRLLEASQPTIEGLIGSRILGSKHVSSSPIPSFLVETESGQCFVKLYQERPPSLTCLVRSALEVNSPPIPAERIKLARLLSAASVAPRVIAADDESGILVQEPLSDDLSATANEAEVLMLTASEQFGALLPIKGLNAELFMRSVANAEIATNTGQVVESVDAAAANLSATVLGVKPRLRKCHPQIELLRIAHYLRTNPWAVRAEFCARAMSVVRFLMAERSLMQTLPRLQHGSMKREHLMLRRDGTAAVCDLDHAGLYVGPHDIAHWFHDQHAGDRAPAPYKMLCNVYRLAASDNDRFLGAVWLAIFPIFDALWRFARGDWQLRLWDMQFLTAYPDAFRKVFTPPRETAELPSDQPNT
jgi:hypothetical protein